MTKKERLIKKRIKIKRNQLNKLIENKCSYDKILKKSQELDVYISLYIKHFNKF